MEEAKAANNTEENTPKHQVKLSLPTAKQDHFYRLRQDGASVKEAAKIVGFHEIHAYRVDRKLKEMSLAHPKTRKLASSALSKILKGQKFGDIDNINASTVMSAIKEVYDRIDPKTNISVQKIDKHVTYDNRVTLEQFKPSNNVVIDVKEED